MRSRSCTQMRRMGRRRSHSKRAPHAPLKSLKRLADSLNTSVYVVHFEKRLFLPQGSRRPSGSLEGRRRCHQDAAAFGHERGTVTRQFSCAALGRTPSMATPSARSTMAPRSVGGHSDRRLHMILSAHQETRAATRRTATQCDAPRGAGCSVRAQQGRCRSGQAGRRRGVRGKGLSAVRHNCHNSLFVPLCVPFSLRTT